MLYIYIYIIYLCIYEYSFVYLDFFIYYSSMCILGIVEWFFYVYILLFI